MAENTGLHAQLLAQAREAGVLEERQRMAAEIHDTIAQGLTGVITQFEAARHAHDRPDEHDRHLANAERLARESLTEARRSVEGALPAPLAAATLPDALREVAREWSDRTTVPVEVTVTGDLVTLDPEIEVTLLRTAQEALANIAKHAQAGRARITLSYMGDEVVLDVHDDGVGFDVGRPATASGAGFGLHGMRQRVARVAGSLAIESEPGRGTAISARSPPSRSIRPRRRHDDPIRAHRRRPPDVRDGLRGMLAAEPDFEVVGEAGDGAEVLALVDRSRPMSSSWTCGCPVSAASSRSGPWRNAGRRLGCWC